MNILKVIVDELPKHCLACDGSDYFGQYYFGRNVLVCMFDHDRIVHLERVTRHPDCPLEENGEIVRLREDNERLREQNKRLLEVVGFMESEE